ncbi:OLC1v1015616C1 [Oldenlandia corymbosa var. corymbosa]|uniref:OLC1v1015616C1 n=1 Tax=Oldenlandia corymbosa var. corymbosa TaxID=529605 RepID=A0AAV1E3X0_OLDCO|nr:OLC1v1015616C1 [Oldenlandia corymbosa var. corymbosa]
MVRRSTFFVFFFLVIAGKLIETKDSCSYFDTIGGGCPDLRACGETCEPCYRGIGVVQFSCVAPGGGILFYRCRCEFKNGAPCPPVGPPTCPAPGGDNDRPDVTYYYHRDDEQKNVTADLTTIAMQFP